MADVDGSQGMEEETGPGGPGAPTPLNALEVGYTSPRDGTGIN